MAVFTAIGREVQENNLRVAEEQFKTQQVLIAERGKPAPMNGFGDWIPIVEMRRVIENGRTVKLEFAIRGEEGRQHRAVGSGGSLLLELTVKDWDCLPVVK